jgi:hypothetical protein
VAQAVVKSHESELVDEIVAGRIEPPADIPGEIFAPALATVLNRRRLEMQALAAELAISRATLYRRAGARDVLLGAVFWYLAKISMTSAFQATTTMRGPERVVAVAEHFMRDVAPREPMVHFLETEPEAALRILTSKQGPVQAGIVAAYRHLIAEEREAGRFESPIDDETLAYVMVRIGESFLYADVIADREPDIDLAVEVYRELLGA